MGELNKKSISTPDFMNRYGNLYFTINDGKIVGYETKESPAPASKRD